MHKIYFCMLATATLQLISMEQLTPIEKTKIEVILSLYKQTDEEMLRNQRFDEADQKACKTLGILWECNNNRYFVEKAVVEISDADLRCHYLRNPQLSAILATSESVTTEPKFSINFPQSLPATFVETLKYKKSMTLINDSCDHPFEIVVTLGDIRKNDSHIKSFTRADYLARVTITAILAGILLFAYSS